jgi:hypothetical protein
VLSTNRKMAMNDGRTERQYSVASQQEQDYPKYSAYLEHGLRNDPEVGFGTLSPNITELPSNDLQDSQERTSTEKKESRSRKICAQDSRKCLKLHPKLIIGALIIIIGLSVGLAVGITHNRGKHETMQGFGAMNGSGIVSLDLGDGSPRITAYTQRWDGVILKSEYLNDSWSGGGAEGDLVTANATIDGNTLAARDGTPLMALSYAHADELIVSYLFFVLFFVADTLPNLGVL